MSRSKIDWRKHPGPLVDSLAILQHLEDHEGRDYDWAQPYDNDLAADMAEDELIILRPTMHGMRWQLLKEGRRRLSDYYASGRQADREENPTGAGEPTTEEALVRALQLVREHLAAGDKARAEQDLDRSRVLIDVMSEGIDNDYEHGWVDAGTRANERQLAKHKVNYKALKEAVKGRINPGRARRGNPDTPSTPDLPKAVANYEDFHKYTPREIGTFPGMVIPDRVVCVGEAEQTLYRSDKWENKNHEYFHDHEAGVNVGRTDASPEDGQMVDLPRSITGATALSMLGQCIGFSYVDDQTGEVVDAKVPPGHELYEVPNRKALLIIDTNGDVAEVKVVLWGGQMVVTDRGIVG